MMFVESVAVNSEPYELNILKVGLSLIIFFVPFFQYIQFAGSWKAKAQWLSPPRVPLFGSLPFFTCADLSQQFSNWKEKYGSTFLLKLGTSDEILVITGFEMAREVLLINGTSFSIEKPSMFNDELELKEYFSTSRSTALNTYQTRRQLIHQITKMMLQFKRRDYIDRASCNLITHIQEQLTISPKEPINIKASITRAVALVSVNLGFGLRWSTQDLLSKQEGRRIIRAIEIIFSKFQTSDIPTLVFQSLADLLPEGMMRQKEQATEVTEELLQSHRSIWRLARDTLEKGDKDTLEPSIVQVLLTDEKYKTLSEFEMYCLTVTTIASAFSSIVYTLHTALRCAAALPDWQQKLQVEIDRYLVAMAGKKETHFLQEYGKGGTTKKMPLLGAFLDEVLRLFPPIKFLTRTAIRDVPLSDGKTIREGQRTVIALQNLNRDPILFKNPDEFDPYRFLTGGKLNETKAMWPKYGHTTFGGGRQVCPGADMARYQVMYFLSRLIEKFEFKMHNSQSGLQYLKGPQSGGSAFPDFSSIIITGRRHND
ncbi:cytochrome P450 monooxygenase [Melampsora larici-populina 98AG31]|uniref:Cytochrome P450 monooxygenase n=1 Tax=Melampsora larici-populina (strain 98AG31 / pathotype 3-4-7) TaxID=747676 RepID=F4R7L7_MELLP|nr:cytochrome P450 monooxygenase [Melampsora larici-populina 98AG31]EGG11762.1 cytochrome P450 monooxygenase [Melampsora larici-populina 98AG31]